MNSPSPPPLLHAGLFESGGFKNEGVFKKKYDNFVGARYNVYLAIINSSKKINKFNQST